MMDSKVISILKEMREDEKRLIVADFIEGTTTEVTHGDKAEALNVAIFELENKDKFYISKDRIEDYIETLNEKIKEFGVKIDDGKKTFYIISYLKEEDAKLVESMFIQRETLKELLGE